MRIAGWVALRKRMVGLVALAVLLGAAQVPVARAQTPSDPPAAAEPSATPTAPAPSVPWYRDWRANIGLFIQYHSLDVTQRGSGLKGSILAQHDYGIFPFASTPEWVFRKEGPHNVGLAVFFGAGQFTVTDQKVKRPDADEPDACDTCDAEDYKNLGTSIRGSYQFITPALVYTFAADPNARSAFRLAAGLGVARGDVSGDIYLTNSGVVTLDGDDDVLDSPKRVRVSDSSSGFDSRSYIILMEFIFPNGVGISASSDFMHLVGSKYRLTLEAFRGGVTFEHRF